MITHTKENYKRIFNFNSFYYLLNQIRGQHRPNCQHSQLEAIKLTCKCEEQQIKKAKLHQPHQNVLGSYKYTNYVNKSNLESITRINSDLKHFLSIYLPVCSQRIVTQHIVMTIQNR